MKRVLFTAAFLLFAAIGLGQTNKDAVFSTKSGAISGYDPVAYFTEGKPVKGEPDITFDWNGATWHFASAANRDAFQQQPEQYAPQYGGWCAYGWAKGYPAKTDPDAWSIVDGRLYLNYNLEVVELWNENQAEFIQKADVNYAAKRDE